MATTALLWHNSDEESSLCGSRLVVTSTSPWTSGYAPRATPDKSGQRFTFSSPANCIMNQDERFTATY
ncbi:hypothetical protein MAR_025184 [Mya arenaria]|uniref:Uncharacterized protein n=1 Tax=Mya arenaria TaxID=6604 RepID=A0ABY7DVC8_MYAAR|nr:hypothetical protein MAR_025184 [Mya arenaria]